MGSASFTLGVSGVLFCVAVPSAFLAILIVAVVVRRLCVSKEEKSVRGLVVEYAQVMGLVIVAFAFAS